MYKYNIIVCVIILPNGKLINLNNILYYGNSVTQIATNNQINILQSQINNIICKYISSKNYIGQKNQSMVYYNINLPICTFGIFYYKLTINVYLSEYNNTRLYILNNTDTLIDDGIENGKTLIKNGVILFSSDNSIIAINGYNNGRYVINNQDNFLSLKIGVQSGSETEDSSTNLQINGYYFL